jgi:hypothetical protein
MHKTSIHVKSAIVSILAFSMTETAAAAGSEAAAKWAGPVVSTPDGGQLRTTIYYGPWQCSVALMSRCKAKCTAQGHPLMGCMWLADIKGDWQGRYLFMPAAAGGRLAVTHCCCDYPLVTDLESRRKTWDRAREGFRDAWSAEFGPWPSSGGTSWAGHHIFDLAHGGAPTAAGNVLPVPADVHKAFNKQYPGCYAGGGQWSTTGVDRPYVD